MGVYLPGLSINYVGMNNDMGKRLLQLYYIKMKISYDLRFIAIGVVIATLTTPLHFLLIFVFLCTRSFFFLRNRLREFVPAIIASIMAKFEQML